MVITMSILGLSPDQWLQLALGLFTAWLFILDFKRKQGRGMRPQLFNDLLASVHQGGALLRANAIPAQPGPQPEQPAPSIPLAVNADRGTVFLSLDGGHWGIFGASGSGKGNALQHIALSLLQHGPAQVDMLILDPKAGLDYAWADKLVHAQLYAAEKLGAGYIEAVRVMHQRNNLLREAGLRNIQEHNRKYPLCVFPYLVVIADEVADLDKVNKARLATLARMGRAAGVVLFVCTQYPTAEALSTQVQANLLNRLVLRLSSKRHTEVALSRGYGEKGELEPAEFTRPGVAVLKQDGGREQLVELPELTESLRDSLLNQLTEAWPSLREDALYDTEALNPHQEAEPGAGEGYRDMGREVEARRSPLRGLPEANNEGLEVNRGNPPLLCSKCGLGEEAGPLRKTPRGGKHIHRSCFGGKPAPVK